MSVSTEGHLVMSISPVASAASYVPQIRPQQPTQTRPAVSAATGGDSDGDNDGSKGGSVDVRA